jgi:hypothetical protein
LKKSQKLAAAIIVLLILSSALIFLKREAVEPEVVENPVENPVEKPIDEPEKDRGPKSLVSLKSEDVSSIEFISGNDKILLENKTLSWTVNKGKVSRIDNGKILSVLRDVLNLKSIETVSFSLENRKQWGIGNSSDRVIINSNGKIITLIIGSLNPSKSGYYIQIEGTEEIYLIKSAYDQSIKIALDDLRIRNLPVIDVDQIETMTINDGSVIKIVPYERYDMFTADLFMYMLVEPYKTPVPVNGENLDKLLEKMKTPLKIVDFIDSGNPEDYGIDENDIKLSVKETSGKKFELLLGKEINNTKVYGKINGEDQIFTLYKKDLPFLDVKPFDLVDRFPQLISIDSIDALSINTDEMAIIGTKDKSESGIVYKINNLEIEEEKFKSFYQDVIYLLMEGEVTHPVNMDRPEIIISFKLYDGGSFWTHLNFYPYNNEFYGVARNEEEPTFIIGRYQLNDMLNKVTKTVDELMGF